MPSQVTDENLPENIVVEKGNDTISAEETPIAHEDVKKEAENRLEDEEQEEVKEVKEVKKVKKEEEPEKKSYKKDEYKPTKGFKFGMSEQKHVSELNFVDLIFYRNVYASLVILLSGSLFFLMITKFEYSVITFIGRIILFQVLAFFIYVVGSRVIRNTSGSPDIPLTNLTITEERVSRIVGSIVQSTNKIIRGYVDILLVKSPKRTVQFALGVQFICWLGKMLQGHVLLYIAFIVAFTVPKIYEFKQEEIDKAFQMAKTEACKLGQTVWEKVPPQARDFVVTAKKKVEELTSERPVEDAHKKNE